jgi:hypothetical protein
MAHSFADYFSRVASDYASYRPRYPDALFAWLARLPARLTADWRLPELAGYLRTWSAMIWGPADMARRVTWPLALRVGRRR